VTANNRLRQQNIQRVENRNKIQLFFIFKDKFKSKKSSTHISLDKKKEGKCKLHHKITETWSEVLLIICSGEFEILK